MGSLISYQIIITSLIKYACVSFGMDKDFIDGKLFSTYQCIPTSIVILYPLSCMRDVSSLRFSSMASIFALIYVGIVLIIEAPEYYNHFKNVADTEPWCFDLNIFTGCSMVFFSFICQIQMLPIYSELKDPSYPRMNKVIKRSIATDAAFYFVIASVGYLSELSQTDPIVLQRQTLPGKGIDYPILIAVIVITLVLVAAYPLQINPLR